MRNIGLNLIWAMCLCLCMIVMLAGCGSNSVIGREILERCMHNNSLWNSISFSGNFSALESDGRNSYRTFTGAEKKTGESNRQVMMVLSGRILNGQIEDATLYYSDDYVYFNTGTGWRKRENGPLPALATLMPYLEDIRVVSNKGSFYQISSKFNQKYLRDSFGLKSGDNQSKDERDLLATINNSSINATFTIQKGSYQLKDFLFTLNMRTAASLGGTSLKFWQYWHYFNYNSQVDVALPSEALDAKPAGSGTLLPQVSGYSQ